MEHQKTALKWMLKQWVEKRGSMLADEMGLGKTFSSISILITLKTTYGQKSGPYLIVCPSTVQTQWSDEIKMWSNLDSLNGLQFEDEAPSSQNSLFPEVFVYSTQTKQQGGVKSAADQHRFKKEIVQKVVDSKGILITSYDQIRMDLSIFARQNWDWIVLDEAQKIKNCTT